MMTRQQGLLERFDQQNVAQQAAIAALWGASEVGWEDAQKMRAAWTSLFRNPIAVRFVWQALSSSERILLFAALAAGSGQNGRATLQAASNLDPTTFTLALERLENFLLLQSALDESGAITPFSDYGDTLLEVGREMYASEESRHQTLAQRLARLDGPSLSRLYAEYGISGSRLSSNTSGQSAFLNALVQGGGALSLLRTLDWSLQYTVALAFENGGRIAFTEADAALHLPLSFWHDLLALAEELCLLFNALDATGQVVFFLPADLYEEFGRKGLAPPTRQMLEEALTQAVIQVGEPLWLYNLAALIGTIFQEELILAGPYGKYPDLSGSHLPFLLHGVPRLDGDGKDQRAAIVWEWALKCGLVRAVPIAMGGYRVCCRPGSSLHEWANYDLVTQTRLVLQRWLQADYWADVLGTNVHRWKGQISWIPDTFTQEGRAVLLRYLRQFEPDRWYPISTLQSSLYTHHDEVLERHLTYFYYRSAPARPSAVGSQYRQWLEREGRCFAGMLVSLGELGLVSLGYRHDPDDQVANSSPDLFQLTPLGYTVLQDDSNVPGEPEQVAVVSALNPPRTFDLIQGDGEMALSYPFTGGIAPLLPFLPFTQVMDIGPVSRLILNRTSIQCGLEYGVCIEQMLETLASLSSASLPLGIDPVLRTWESETTGKRSALLAPLAESPELIEAQGPVLLYDLAVLLGSISADGGIATTERGTLPKRFVKKLRPLLHGLPRLNAEGEDDYPLIVLEEAASHGLLAKSQPSHWSKSVRYELERDGELEHWKTSTLLSQMQFTLGWWLSTFNAHWRDLAGSRFSLYIKSDWNPYSARILLLNYLQRCRPGQWYSVSSLLDIIWQQDPHALRPDRLLAQSEGLSTGLRRLTRNYWALCDGELYRGILLSSLFELGIVSLGCTIQRFSGTAPWRNDFDCFSITELGSIVLDRWHGRMPRAKEPAAPGGPSLVVQPNFEALLLQPDIPTLYRVLPFCQITQIGQLSKLTLTQSSVRSAQAQEWTSERILSTLQQVSSKELPQNVVYTIEQWCRH
jgi:hypothetical protein